jgi:hypothetical protein
MSAEPYDAEPYDAERIESRAGHLLPEERAAGSTDPRAQAAAILTESDAREYDGAAAPDSFLERRTSEQTVSPAERTPTPAEPPD